MPDTIDAAVETARKLKAVELAQKRFYRERRGSDQVTATLAQVTVNECPGQVGQTVTADVQRPQAQRRGISLQCWHCKQPGHIRREYPILQQSLERPGGRGLPPAMIPKTKSTAIVGGTCIDTRLAPSICGVVEGCSILMLGNTGSALTTVVRTDIWEKLVLSTEHKLSPATQAVVAAKGKGISLSGQVKLEIQIEGLKVKHLCLVAKDLTHEFHLGSDFLYTIMAALLISILDCFRQEGRWYVEI
ncbi:hypothetical protein EMCRGX_G021061 [Ephydatia muelleri]